MRRPCAPVRPARARPAETQPRASGQGGTHGLPVSL